MNGEDLEQFLPFLLGLEKIVHFPVPVLPDCILAGEVDPRSVVGEWTVHRYHRIDEHGEVRARDFVSEEIRCTGSQVSSGREAHYSYLVHLPFGGVGATVAERVLHVIERHCPVSVRHSVLDHAYGDASLKQPFGHIYAFVEAGNIFVSAARADYDHLAVGFLREIEVETGLVAYVAEIAAVGESFISAQAVGLDRASGFRKADIDALPLGIEPDGLGWSEFCVRLLSIQ